METGEATIAASESRPAERKSPRTKSARAFTRTELLIIIFGSVLLALLLLPLLARRHPSKGIYCGNNLKQIGLAFRTWAIDNNGLLPVQVSVTNGGTMELLASGAVFPHFQVMSNELSTPRILLCPNDENRSYATNFTSGLTDKNISYFVNVDAINGNASSLLCGDRNITNRASAGSRLVSLTKGATIAWTKELHSKQGILLFWDGSVKEVTNGAVADAIRIPDGVTNRLAVP